MQRITLTFAPRHNCKSAPRPYDPRINRWTGQPHEHQREIARRQRQQARSN